MNSRNRQPRNSPADFPNFTADEQPECEARLDRLIFYATEFQKAAFLALPGYRCSRSHFLRSSAYRRLIELQSENSGAKIQIYYGRRVPWVAPCKIVLIADDPTGLQPSQVFAALELLTQAKLSMVELACDFNGSSGVDVAFVQRHVLFGKSRFLARKPGIMWFGSRRSSKLVRTYWKPEICAFRIELELHSRWLRNHGIGNVFDFNLLPTLLARHHLFFCRLEWGAVFKRIRRSSRTWRFALRNLEWQRNDLLATLNFLRREVCLTNTHRLLVPLETNEVVLRALKKWARRWPPRPFGLMTNR